MASITAYAKVAESLRSQILSGEMRPCSQMPTEHELCERYSASRITIRRALDILAEELLIQKRQGSGTFVSAKPSRKVALLNSDFEGSIALHAPDLKRRLVIHDWREASQEVADQLGVAVGEKYLFAQRIDSLGDIAIATDEVLMPACYASHLSEADFCKTSFLDRWQAVEKIHLEYLTEVTEAVSAKKPISALLGVRSGTPLLKETDTVFLSGSRVAGVFVSYYRHNYFRMTSTVRMSESTDDPSMRKAHR